MEQPQYSCTEAAPFFLQYLISGDNDPTKLHFVISADCFFPSLSIYIVVAQSKCFFTYQKDPAKTPATAISTTHRMTFVVSPVWGLLCCLWMEEEGVELPPLGVDELPPPPPEEGVEGVVFVPFGASTMATFWISPVSFTINLTSSATSYPLGAVSSRRV